MTGIYLLNDPKILKANSIGPKAANLARLLSSGFPVPKGFCITGDIYREHLKRNNLSSLIQNTLKEINNTKQDDISDLLNNLRKTIIEAPIAESVRESIEKHLGILNAGSIAVRSSATAEDLPDKSFAGQYETYLGIKNSDDCIKAIKKCWAFLWTERVYKYRSKNNIDHIKVDMAVIIQQLIEADTSGVIFTADPITGRRKSIVIESCFGLGQALVSGKVTPDRLIVDKDTMKVFFRTVSDKKIESSLYDKEAVEEHPLSSQRSTKASLNKRQIKRLAKIAQSVETGFGPPQDIEWAIKDSKIWLLQSRPITNLPTPKQKSWEERQIWTNSNVGEAAPDVMTPLTWSVIGELVDVMFEPVLKMLCVKLGDNPLFGIIAGRVYFNMNTIIAGFHHLFPRGLDLNTAMGGHQKQLVELGRLSIPPEDLPDIGGSLMKVILRLPLSIAEVLLNGNRRRKKLMDFVIDKNDYMASLDLEKLTSEQLADELKLAVQIIHKLNLLCLFTAIAAIPSLQKLCDKWLKDENHSIFNRLLAGAQGMEDAQTGFELASLAAAANQNEDLRKIILSENKWSDIHKQLKLFTRGREFLQQWHSFMNTNGHHCRGEIEMLNPRWKETPDYILTLVRSYMQAPDLDTGKKRRQISLENEKLLRQCCNQLGPIKRIIFKRAVKKAKEGCLFRENSKNRMVRYIACLRQIALSIGQKLTEEGLLLEPDDIFFLKYQEVSPAVKGRNFTETIKKRRTEYLNNMKITPPPVVVGKFNPDEYSEEFIDSGRETLTGLSVSPGTATGPARVILHASDDYVRPGEILVAPFTDPGWTPYFVNAAGIVMDMGGLLSHGSIVAREYGIPCVVNVGMATKIIRTGQIITVNANLGIVQLIQ